MFACRWGVLLCVVGVLWDVLLLWMDGFLSDVLLCVFVFPLGCVIIMFVWVSLG